MRRAGYALCVAWLGGGLAGVGPAFGQAPGTSQDAPPGAVTTELRGARFFAGVRLWANQWDIPSTGAIVVVPGANSPPVLQEVVGKSLSKTEFVPILVAGMSAGNFRGSVSYFVRTGYDSRDPSLGKVYRDEFDVTLGYAVAPSLVLSVGYKRATQSKLSAQISPSDAKVSGVLLGASASAPLVGKLFLYGNAAYGLAREKTAFSDAAGNDSYSGSYRIGEVGVSFPLYESAESAGIRNVLVTFGYRAQNFTTKSVALGTYALTTPPTLLAIRKTDVNTSTDGFILGIVGSF